MASTKIPPPGSRAPLAERMRPQSLDDVVGQQHMIGPGSLLLAAVSQSSLPSMILWGPPGVGKTTLAGLLAKAVGRHFFQLSAINSGVREIRGVIDDAALQPGAILFIDEIHRFNKSQQDALLGAVEKGIITLIGATTENPSFEVNGALLSRAQVFVLKPLEDADMHALLHRALQHDTVLSRLKIELQQTEALLRLSGGDARKLLNGLEITVQHLYSNGQTIVISNDAVLNAVQANLALYDKSGEMHYDIISAFIKSIRGSDPNGAVYWLARMIDAGEDIKFIARRLLILASEDIGNANPTALVMANACFEAVQKIGYPEGRIILSQCTTYLASSPKSNAAYLAIENALSLVTQFGDLPVPLHLRNAPTKLMKTLNYGKHYTYSHDGKDNFIGQEYLPETIAGKALYIPGANAREEEIRKFLKTRWGNKYNY